MCEEIPEFSQMDCVTDDCMILDVWDAVYVWIGADARDDEKKEAERLAMVISQQPLQSPYFSS